MPPTRYEWWTRHATDEYAADLVTMGHDSAQARLAAARDVFVDEAHRGKGNARQALLLGEELAARHGAVRIGLRVFGFNAVAKALDDSLGYTTTSIKMSKELSPPST